MDKNWPLFLTIMGITPLFMSIIGVIAAFFQHRSQWIERILGWLTVSASAALLGISIWMVTWTDYPFRASWHPFAAPSVDFYFTIDFYVDQLSVFFILLVNIVAFAASWNSLDYLNDIEPTQSAKWWQKPIGFHILVNLFHFTMLLVPMLDNLVGVWIAIELTTVGSAFLVAHQSKRSSWEATWKYLIITSTGIILALLGTVFLANALSVNIEISKVRPEVQDSVMSWSFLVGNTTLTYRNGMPVHPELNKTFVWFAFLFALVGYGTKAGLAPMHTWLPDAHGEAPSPISALLSGVLLKSALYVILRFYILANLVLEEEGHILTSGILLGMGLFSLIVATPFILKENPFKRVLAYHSLEHMGIIVFGLGLGGSIAIFGAVLHMLNHAITKSLMFLSFGNVMKRYEKRGILQPHITGIFRSMPITGTILALGGLALVGTPPFNIFVSELIILWGGLKRLMPLGEKAPQYIPDFPSQVIVIAIVLFLSSTTLIFYGLVNHLRKLTLGKMSDDLKLKEGGGTALGPLFFLFVLMLILGIYIWSPLANLVDASTQIIMGGTP